VIDPVVELTERLGVDGIQATRTLGPDRREAGLAQHLQVLRYGRLRDPELRLDDRRDRPRAQLAIGEQLQDTAADGIAEDIERMHVGEDTSPDLYKSRPVFEVDVRGGTVRCVSNDQIPDPVDAVDLAGSRGSDIREADEPAAPPPPLRILAGDGDLVCVDDACAPLEPAR